MQLLKLIFQWQVESGLGRVETCIKEFTFLKNLQYGHGF